MGFGLTSTPSSQAQVVMESPTFSHPTEITNRFLPLSALSQDILSGKEGRHTILVERTFKPDLHKWFIIGDRTVEALVFEDREYTDGKLSEVALDYFAQADDGTVYYLGEKVDIYKKGKIVSHAGSWLYGKDTRKPGVLMPAHPKVGDKYKSEDVSKKIVEEDEVISVSETVVTPSGTYHDCLKIKEKTGDGEIEYKYFAPGVGCVREAPENGDVLLRTHQTR